MRRPTVPEDVFQTDLIAYPWPWAFRLPKAHLIIVSDQELRTLASDPDAVLDMSLTHDKVTGSLRSTCADAKAKGCRTLILAFDHFFGQYRPGQEGTRALTPDRPEAIALIAQVSQFASAFGLGLELSLLSPLEVGPGDIAETGEAGRWYSARKGLRDPKTGRFSVQYWRHERWANNKGPIDLKNLGARVFAFKETPLPHSSYRVVEPKDIIEITECAKIEEWELEVRQGLDFIGRRVRVHGEGRTGLGPAFNRVVVVQMSETPEMDYFSPRAKEYLRRLVERYRDAGVVLNALYSDEMHIQSAWNYFTLHEHGQYTHRYVSPHLEKTFAARHGAQYEDFARWMPYFVCGQEEFAHDLSARADIQHVIGDTPEAVAETALLRSWYYRHLQDGVVDLFAEAKRLAEDLLGKQLEARAHATWAESPTIDAWEAGPRHHCSVQYEYTPDFLWSCTVHQASAACHDYFKWNDFLTGAGTDHAESGWSDRNYHAPALAASIGMTNDVPYAYAAHWGMPAELSRHRAAVEACFGGVWPTEHDVDHVLVQEMSHRDVEVLMLYPLDLVAATERFGSWMTQYGYANQVTAAKLLEEGEVKDGAITIRGRRFTTLCALYEPLPKRGLLDLMEEFVEGGGKLVWSGPPPVIDEARLDARAPWEALVGARALRLGHDGYPAPACEVLFEGGLASVPAQFIPTHFPVDRIHPLEPHEGTEVVARVKGKVVGTARKVGKGLVLALGFRPRDDQSASLGREVRTWFEILDAIDAYTPSGKFPGINDCTEAVSRTTDFLACRFPNGTTSVTRHFRHVEEAWDGGFGRDHEDDAEYLKEHPAPPFGFVLEDFLVNGQRVSYRGAGVVSWRRDAQGRVLAFAGEQCRGITLDGVTTDFSDHALDSISFAPVAEARRVPGGTAMLLKARPAGPVTIPAHWLKGSAKALAEGPTPGSRGDALDARLHHGELTIEITDAAAGRWIHILEA